MNRRYGAPPDFTEADLAEEPGPRRLIVGISGASGVIYGVRLLELLRPLPIETHLVISRAAEVALAAETDLKPAVAPCSIRSMAEIASGVTTTLLSRAADVVLKERRRLVLMVRETPLHTGHLRTMTALSEMGAVIAPPVPAFYAKPQSLAEMIDQTLGRVLDLFGLETGRVRRWGEAAIAGTPPLRSKPRRGAD